MKTTLLEQMAKRMPEADAKKMAAHWGYMKEKESEEIPMISSKAVATASPSSPSASNSNRRLMLDDEELLMAAANSSPKEKHLLHPVFGELVASLGYKQVYLTSVKSLAHAHVWEKQRILRPERAARIMQSKIAKANGSAVSLSGVITMFLDAETGASGIIDGQHRAAALVLLAQQGHWNEYSRNVLVDVFITKNDSEIADLFKEINSAEPVRLVDMPVRCVHAAKMSFRINHLLSFTSTFVLLHAY